MKPNNSQKRIYNEDSIYFVTFKTLDNFPYFKNGLLCDLFVKELELSKEMKQFMLFDFVILYDHVHLLLRPGKNFDISKCIHFIKRHFSRNANIALGFTSFGPVDEDGHPRLQDVEKIDEHVKISRLQFQNNNLKTYFNSLLETQSILQNRLKNGISPLKKFKWQKSFHDHIIRTEADFVKHRNYISTNNLKHNLPANWRYIGYNYPELIYLT